MAEEIPKSKPLWGVGAKKEKEQSTNVVIVGNDMNFFIMVLITFKWILAFNMAVIPFALLYYLLS